MKTGFTFLTIIFVFAISAHANHQLVSKSGKEQPLRKVLQAMGGNTSHFKHLIITENQLSVPRNSEDYSWDEDLNDWQHVSNTTYTYDNAGRLTDELLKEPGTEMNISRISYAYDLSGNITVTEEFEYNMEINQWFPVSGEQWINTLTAESQINGVIQQTIDNGVWVNKTWIEYYLNQFNIPTQLRTYHWNGIDWSLHNRIGLLTWADWPHRELAAYTMQYWQDNNWVNAERYSTQYDGDNYTATTEIWENGEWVNSKRETYSLTTTEEELILENWTAQGWENTEKYQGTFDINGNPTGMKYSSWNDNDWIVDMALFMDLTYNESNDVTEMAIRSWDPSITAPKNLSKYIYSNFLHFTTDVPEIAKLLNVKVYPNPVSSNFTIQIDDNQDSRYQVNIVNLLGRTVFSDTYSNSPISINAEELPEGMYLVNIKSDEGFICTRKLLKN